MSEAPSGTAADALAPALLWSGGRGGVEKPIAQMEMMGDSDHHRPPSSERIFGLTDFVIVAV